VGSFCLAKVANEDSLQNFLFYVLGLKFHFYDAGKHRSAGLNLLIMMLQAGKIKVKKIKIIAA
jgi:hypothetical protein